MNINNMKISFNECNSPVLQNMSCASLSNMAKLDYYYTNIYRVKKHKSFVRRLQVWFWPENEGIVRVQLPPYNF